MNDISPSFISRPMRRQLIIWPFHSSWRVFVQSQSSVSSIYEHFVWYFGLSTSNIKHTIWPCLRSAEPALYTLHNVRLYAIILSKSKWRDTSRCIYKDSKEKEKEREGGRRCLSEHLLCGGETAQGKQIVD
jgi:hypothetical protein